MTHVFIYTLFSGSDSATPSPSTAGTGDICLAGHYCPQESVTSTACPLGTFYSGTGATQLSDCVDCTSGSYCNAMGLSAPVGLCTAGYYCVSRSAAAMPTPASAVGGPCTAGFYCPEGATEALQCLAGSYTLTGLQAECVDCPAGYYCETGANTITDCPTGIFYSRT